MLLFSSKMDLNKHIITNGEKPFHSNGYAVVASGDRIGSTSSVSFNQRRAIDQNRRVINGYHQSSIGSKYGEMRAKTISDIKITKPNIQTSRFAEPAGRKYNPFS